MTEKWKWIIEDYYQASNMGRVRSVDRVVRHYRGGTLRLKSRIMQLTPDKDGYLTVCLQKYGVRQVRKVHKLVAEAFIGPCPEGQQVCHNSKTVTDNSVGNLRYDTAKNNNLQRRKDGTHCGRAIRRSDGVEFINMHVAAEDSDCDSSDICKVCKGRRKTTGGFGWKYIKELE